LALFNKNQQPFLKKAMALNDNIPYQYNKPQIKVDFDFDYKVRLLDLYIHLDNIPDKRWCI
jgi:hypothetical protein